MTDLRHTMCSFYLLTLLLATPAFAASISVELTSEASRPAVNDLVHATVAAEAAGPTAAESSKQVNGLIADALKLSLRHSAGSLAGRQAQPQHPRVFRCPSVLDQHDCNLRCGRTAWWRDRPDNGRRRRGHEQAVACLNR